MSDVRSPDAAHADDTEAPSVEETAPELGSEVGDGSAPQHQEPPAGFVEAARFNGLMGKFNQTQSALKAAEERLAALEQSLQAQETTEETPHVAEDQDRIAQLEAAVGELAGLLKSERAQSARAKALEKYPEAAIFADLIQGESDEDFESLAQVISERVKSAGVPATGDTDTTDTADTTQTTETGGATEAPVVAGGTSFSGDAATAEKIADAIKNRDFATYLRLKQEEASARIDAEALGG